MSGGTGDRALRDQRIEVFDAGTPPPPPPARSSSLPKIIAAVSGVLALLYLCSPIDLIPEAVLPFVGFVDDLIVFVVGLAIVGILLLAIRSQDRKQEEILRQQHALRQQEQVQRLIDLRLQAVAAQPEQDPSRHNMQALPPPLDVDDRFIPHE